MTDTNQKLREVLQAAQQTGCAHNNGAGGQYLICATEAQLLAFAQALSLPTAAPVDEREAFETWMEAPPPVICAEGSPMAGEYRDSDWQQSWEAFQAGVEWQARAFLQSGADTVLLRALRDNSWGLVPFDMPTGQGDADIGWRVIGYHMNSPTERTVAEFYRDDPAAAIEAAIARGKGE